MNDEVLTVEEKYIVANRSSHLRVEADKAGAVDLLICAGWSQSRIGMALMRLKTKADRAGLEQVHTQIAIQAARWNIEHPEAVAAAVLAWWLNRLCGACHGRKFELVKDTPMLSTKQCKPCRGAGEMPTPCGNDGFRLAGYLDDCKSVAAGSISRRLGKMQNKVDAP